MKLGHVHIKVRNLETSIDFYQHLFDLKLTEKLGSRFAFLTGNDMHHTLALQAKGADAPPDDPSSVGLFHVAFEVPTKKELAKKYRLLASMGLTPHPVDHRISWAIYFNDPDGNGLEIYVDTRDEEHSSMEWLGKDRHLSKNQILDCLQ